MAMRTMAARTVPRRGARHHSGAAIDIPRGVDLVTFLETRGRWGEREGAVAFKDGASGATLTYDRLRPSLTAAGTALAKQKIKQLMLVLPNCVNFPVAFFGGVSQGVVVNTCSPLFTPQEYAHQIRDSGAQQILTVAALRPALEEAVDMVGLPRSSIVVLGEAGSEHFAVKETSGEVEPRVEYAPVDPAREAACMLYSSGTTGLPKGVMLSHENLVANVCQILDDPQQDLVFNMGQHPEGRHFNILNTLPFYHVYPLVVAMMAPLTKGGTVVVMPKFDPALFLQLLQNESIDAAPVVPPIMIFLAKHPLVDQFDLSRLRTLYSAAAPCDPSLQKAVRDRLGVVVAQAYGMTELSPAATGSPMAKVIASGGKDVSDIPPGSIGKAFPNTELRLVDSNDALVTEPNTPGELHVRGPQVMLGYHNNEAATKATIDGDGWLKTGDVCTRDADGNYYVVDRLKELIKVKGVQVAAAELEGHILRHPAVADVAVIPMPDERTGERPRACVALKPEHNATEEEIKEHVARDLNAIKHLGAVNFVDEVPKSASGKILRRLLRDKFAAA